MLARFQLAADGPADPGVLEVRGVLRRRSPLRLWLAGELCAYSVARLAGYLDRHAGASDVVLDLWDITFIDSTGVLGCIELSRRWKDEHHSLTVANPSAAVCRVVSLLDLDEELFGPPPDGRNVLPPPARTERGPAG